MGFNSLNDQQELAFVSYSFWEDLYSLVNKMRNFQYCRYYMEEDGQTREVGERINDECQGVLVQISKNLDETRQICIEEPNVLRQ
jgi:hypothetical protein